MNPIWASVENEQQFFGILKVRSRSSVCFIRLLGVLHWPFWSLTGHAHHPLLSLSSVCT